MAGDVGRLLDAHSRRHHHVLGFASPFCQCDTAAIATHRLVEVAELRKGIAPIVPVAVFELLFERFDLYAGRNARRVPALATQVVDGLRE